jgi:hypothetical protein
VARKPTDELDLAALRAQARKKPRTKAGQIRQAWPEIRDLLATGHSLKDVWAWLKDIGIVVPYTRLSEYVNQMRRRDADGVTSTNVSTRRAAADGPPTEAKTDVPASSRNPLENVQRSEAQRPGFNYRPALPADEKDLI